MKKILIIESSPRKGFCTKTADAIKNRLKSKAEVELLTLRDYNISACKGCAACLTAGSAYCPLREDDAKKILNKLLEADGVIYVVPNYALQIPGILKNLFDRLSYVFHRPRLFGKVCLPIIVQGVYGGGKISKYINEVMEFWGMTTVNGAVTTGGVYPNKGKDEITSLKDDRAIDKALNNFNKAMEYDKPRQPSLFRVIIFRSTRSSMKYFPQALEPDKKYFKKNGWLDSQYFYDVKLNPFKIFVGNLMDLMMKNMATKSNK